MDEIKTRLKDASDACLTRLETWRGKTSDAAARESLQEAVHELRKVTARIEIELAVSDRKTQGYEPIPIPAHRASRRPGGDDMDDDRGHNPGNRAQGNRDGNRSNQSNQGGGQLGGAPRPVQIRKASDAPATATAENPGNDSAAAAPAGDEEGGQRKRPLSLKRSAPDAE